MKAFALLAILCAGCGNCPVPRIGLPDRVTFGMGYQQDPADRNDRKMSASFSVSCPVVWR